jgi:hypothetical protein
MAQPLSEDLPMARSFVAPLALALSLGGGAAAVADTIEVWKTATCGCCASWVEHLAQNGFSPKAANVAAGQLAGIKAQAGLPPQHQSCHTAKVGGYVIEGHVPAADIKRLLADKPDAVGLAVPGMPIGSPGMESGDASEPYEVLLIRRDGTSEVFAKH